MTHDTRKQPNLGDNSELSNLPFPYDLSVPENYGNNFLGLHRERPIFYNGAILTEFDLSKLPASPALEESDEQTQLRSESEDDVKPEEKKGLDQAVDAFYHAFAEQEIIGKKTRTFRDGTSKEINIRRYKAGTFIDTMLHMFRKTCHLEYFEALDDGEIKPVSDDSFDDAFLRRVKQIVYSWSKPYVPGSAKPAAAPPKGPSP